MASIKNRSITKVHTVFKNLRDICSKFFQQKDQSLIRFSFSETIAYWQFIVKFANTHKRIKFVVSKDGDMTTVEYIMYEKTKNIILDIDQIYRERKRDWLTTNETLKKSLESLFFWGITYNENRRDEIYRCEVELIPEIESEIYDSLRNDILYYGVITRIHELNKCLNEHKQVLYRCIVYFNHTKANGEQASIEITCTEDARRLLRPNKLLMLNWMGRFSAMSFMNSLHHFKFTDAQRRDIDAHLNSLRKES